jgi:hypothetical protein
MTRFARGSFLFEVSSSCGSRPQARASGAKRTRDRIELRLPIHTQACAGGGRQRYILPRCPQGRALAKLSGARQVVHMFFPLCV